MLLCAECLLLRAALPSPLQFEASHSPAWHWELTPISQRQWETLCPGLQKHAEKHEFRVELPNYSPVFQIIKKDKLERLRKAPNTGLCNPAQEFSCWVHTNQSYFNPKYSLKCCFREVHFSSVKLNYFFKLYLTNFFHPFFSLFSFLSQI